MIIFKNYIILQCKLKQVSQLLVPKEFDEKYFFMYYDTDHEDPKSAIAAADAEECVVGLRKWLELKKKEKATDQTDA